MANGNCQCHGVVGNLISHITPYLRALKIFDIGNVFVCCLDLQIKNNRIRILNSRNPSRKIVSSAGVYVVVGNSCKLGCDKRSNIIYIGSTEDLQRRIGEFRRTLERGNNQHSGAQKIRKAILINNISQTCLYVIGFPINDKFVEDKKEEIIKKLFKQIREFEELVNKEKTKERTKRKDKDFLKKVLKEIMEKLLSLKKEEKEEVKIDIKEVEDRISEISNLETLSDEIKRKVEGELQKEVEKVFINVVKKLLLLHKILPKKVEGCFQADYRHFYLIDPCFVDQTEDPDFNIFLIRPDDARRTIKFILTTIDIFFRDCIRNC